MAVGIPLYAKADLDAAGRLVAGQLPAWVGFSAAGSPTAGDDAAGSAGHGTFVAGATWLQTVPPTLWVCADASVGAAVWRAAPVADAEGILDAKVAPTYVSEADLGSYVPAAGELFVTGGGYGIGDGTKTAADALRGGYAPGRPGQKGADDGAFLGGAGGAAGTINLSGGDGGHADAGMTAPGGKGGHGGSINLSGGSAPHIFGAGNGGSIDMHAPDTDGISGQSYDAGSLMTYSAAAAYGGSIKTHAGTYADGGPIYTYGGTAFGGDGGSITTYGGGNMSPGGNIDTHGGSGDNQPGGSITTSAGGGSIDTTGNGRIEMGTTANRITLVGAAGAGGKTLTLPAVTGTVFTDRGGSITGGVTVNGTSALAGSVAVGTDSAGNAYSPAARLEVRDLSRSVARLSSAQSPTGYFLDIVQQYNANTPFYIQSGSSNYPLGIAVVSPDAVTPTVFAGGYYGFTVVAGNGTGVFPTTAHAFFWVRGGNMGASMGEAVFKRALIVGNLASAPAAEAGKIYFNTTDNHFYGYNGTAWKQLDN